eukprot:UN08471
MTSRFPLCIRWSYPLIVSIAMSIINCFFLAFALLPALTAARPVCSVRPSNTTTPTSAPNTAPSSVSSPLFPVSSQPSSWTTSSSISGALPLSDDTFRPFKEIKALSHNYTNAPDGELSMQAHYPAGSFTFSNTPQGGFSFYAPGPANVDLTTAKGATFGYTVYFPSGFQFVKGGKLPG